MDIPSSPPSVSSTLAPRYRSSDKGIIIGGFALIIFAAILVFALPRLHPNSGFSVTSFAYAAGILPGSALYIANTETGSSTPLTVIVEGKALHALDAQRASDGTWYFILNEGGTSNVYKKTSDGNVTRLTHSATAKYNLSFDQTSGRLAYQALTPPADENPSFLLRTDWNITMISPNDATEMVIATGTDPFLALGGSQVLFRKGNTLLFQGVGQKTSAPVLVLPSAVYAINPKGTMITVFNPVTKNLDQYAFTNGFSPNYKTSIQTKDTPTALGYVNDELMAAYSANSNEQSRLIFMPVGSASANISLPAITSGSPQRIYTYE